MSNFKDIRKQVIQARKERDEVEEQLHTRRAKLLQIENQLADSARTGKTSKDIVVLRKKLQDEVKKLEEVLTEQNKILEKTLDRYEQLPNHEDLLRELNDHIPFLLFPVRLETKFMKSGNGKDELWVRIFPDDIAIETHENSLTEDEVTAGRAYWKAVWEAAGDEKKTLAAWQDLVESYDSPRAAWIARCLTPVNINNIPPRSPESVFQRGTHEEPTFPDIESSKDSSWTCAPRVRIMPDRFIICAYQKDANNGRLVCKQKVTSRPIPDPLIVGPDPTSKNGFLQTDGKLQVDPEMEWITNFQKAVEVGMAVCIPISQEEANKGFDRILALGLKLSSDEVDGKQRLENLINSHHYTGGFSLVPQGTPTNNTEESKAGYSSFEPGDENNFRVGMGEPLFEGVHDEFEKSDGQKLAEALGIDYTVLQHIHHSDGYDGKEAMAMNIALWPATLGYFMEEMMRPVFNPRTIEKTRDFFTKYVSGRGPLAAIRVDTQPYGILPTTVFSKWKWPQEEDNYYSDLYDILRRFDSLWNAKSKELTSIGTSEDPDQELLHKLGLHATSIEFYQRLAAGMDYLWNIMVFCNGNDQNPLKDWHANNQKNNLTVNMKSELNRELEREWNYDFPPDIKIFSTNFLQDQIKLTGPLISDAPLSEEKTLSDNNQNYIDWLITSELNDIREEVFDGKPPIALLYLLLRHAKLLQYWNTALRLLIRDKSEITKNIKEKPPEVEFLNMQEKKDVTRWDYFDIKIPDLTGKQNIGEYLSSKSDEDDIVSFNKALKVLEYLPTARLERLLAEHLDLCNYRLDAWQLAIVNYRLQQHRHQAENRWGIYLGAFGWLEDIRPATSPEIVPQNEIPEGFDEPGAGSITQSPDNAGYIHAPSLNHATTAAILRNAYITHSDKNNAELMSVSLTSERVRWALWYIDGVRNGQELGALLGYQFERGLHENDPSLNLDRYINNFRQKFPLVSGQIIESPANAPIETLEARNVVNGLKLIEAKRSHNYPYTVEGLPGSESEKGKAIQAEVARIIEHLDALGDLALAESVFQVSQGNYDRAGAMLKAISEAGYIPEPEIVRTPRSGTTLTHRVILNLDSNSSGNPWSDVAMTPRAYMEPRLNNWIGAMLGDPANIKCTVTYNDGPECKDGPFPEVSVSLKDLHIQPIDFLYLTGQDFHGESTELENRIDHYVRKTYSLNQKSLMLTQESLEKLKSEKLPAEVLEKLKTEMKDRRFIREKSFLDNLKNTIGDADFEQYKLLILKHALNQEVLLKVELISRKESWNREIKTFFEILPLVNSLREIITGCRPLGADNFILPSDDAHNRDNPQGFKLAELRGRVDRLRNSLLETYETLDNRKNEVIEYLKVNPVTEELSTKLAVLRDDLSKAALFGIPDAVPFSAVEVNRIISDELIAQVENVLVELNRRWNLSESSDNGTLTAESLISKGQAILGRSFKILPLFSLHNPDEVRLAIGNRVALMKDAPPLAVDEWVQGVARVRAKISTYQTITLLAETMQHISCELTPAQLPYKENARWLALPFTDNQEIDGDKLSLIMQLPADYNAVHEQSGLVIDEWTEIIPNRSETTSVAFHFNQPNSEPPQSLLLALSPEIAGKWVWEDLIDTLQETLDMAKKRAVEPEHLDANASAQLLPAIMAAMTTNNTTISLDFAKNLGT